MKINRPTVDPLAPYETRKVEKGQDAKSSKRPNSTSEGPIAQISEQAWLVQRVRLLLDQMPDSRPEVEELMKELQQKLEDGAYLDEVSGEKIIQDILQELKDGQPA